MATEYVLAHGPNLSRTYIYGTADEVKAVAPPGTVIIKVEVIGEITKRSRPLVFWNNDKKPCFPIIFSLQKKARAWLKEYHHELKLGTNIYWNEIYHVTEIY
jgi:hypothetical protein